jgi:hypothetical protein
LSVFWIFIKAIFFDKKVENVQIVQNNGVSNELEDKMFAGEMSEEDKAICNSEVWHYHYENVLDD